MPSVSSPGILPVWRFGPGRPLAQPARVPAGHILIFLRQERLPSEPRMPAWARENRRRATEGRIEPAPSLPLRAGPVTIRLVTRNARHVALRAGAFALVAWSALSCGKSGTTLVSPAGVVWTRVTPSGVSEADRPDWLADSIAFQVRFQGSDRVAVALEDGSGVIVEPQAGTAGSRSPRWVRGGLLIESSDLSGSEDLWYRDVSTGVTRRLTAFAGAESNPAPRPGSPGIIYVEGSDPDSGRLVLIPDTSAAPLGRIYFTPAALGAGEPSFNPAGDHLCFSAAGPNGSRQIWKLSFSDTLAVQLTVAGSVNPPSGPVIDRSPRWSPDGTRILMASNRGGRWGVWALDPMGEAQGLSLIAQDLAGAEIRHPVWSPDGTEIMLSSDRSGERALWRLTGF